MKKESVSSKEPETKNDQDIQDTGNTQETVKPGENEKTENKTALSQDDNRLKQVHLSDFDEAVRIKESNSLKLLKDVPLKVVVELGRTTLKIKDLMELGIGSIIELNKLYGDAVDIYVNNKFIGKGEVVVIDEDFAVRITEIIKNPELGK